MANITDKEFLEILLRVNQEIPTRTCKLVNDDRAKSMNRNRVVITMHATDCVMSFGGVPKLFGSGLYGGGCVECGIKGDRSISESVRLTIYKGEGGYFMARINKSSHDGPWGQLIGKGKNYSSVDELLDNIFTKSRMSIIPKKTVKKFSYYWEGRGYFDDSTRYGRKINYSMILPGVV